MKRMPHTQPVSGVQGEDDDLSHVHEQLLIVQLDVSEHGGLHADHDLLLNGCAEEPNDVLLHLLLHVLQCHNGDGVPLGRGFGAACVLTQEEAPPLLRVEHVLELRLHRHNGLADHALYYLTCLVHHLCGGGAYNQHTPRHRVGGGQPLVLQLACQLVPDVLSLEEVSFQSTDGDVNLQHAAQELQQLALQFLSFVLGGAFHLDAALRDSDLVTRVSLFQLVEKVRESDKLAFGGVGDGDMADTGLVFRCRLNVLRGVFGNICGFQSHLEVRFWADGFLTVGR